MPSVLKLVKSFVGSERTVADAPQLGEELSRNEPGNSPENADRRHHVRQPAPFGYIELGKHNGGIVLNISESGLAVQAVRSVIDPHLPEIRFQFSESTDWIEARGRVTWTNASRKMLGLEFVDLPEESRARIREWIFLELHPRENGEEANSHSDLQQQTPGTLASAESAVATQNTVYPQGSSGSDNQGEDPLAAQYAILDDWNERFNKREQLENSSPTVSVAPESSSPPAEKNETSGSHKLYWLLATSALVAFLLVAFVESDKRTRDSAKVESPNDSHMGLKLERAGSDWRLSWNPDARVISKAPKGHLLISDGDFHKFLDLDSSDLRGGTILYHPLTNDVVFRLEVDMADSPTTISESVRASGGLLGSLASPGLKHVPSNNPRGLTELSVAASSRNNKEVANQSSAPKTSASATEEVKPVQSTQTNIQDASEQLAPASSPDAKLQGTEPFDSAFTLPSGFSQLYPVSPAVPFPLPPAQELTLRPTHLESAELISKRNPVYPPSAREAGVSGAVEVHFRIRGDGTVDNVRFIRGNPLLGFAAVEAVRAWRYKPARLNGTAIETEGSAVVDFK